MTSSSPLSFGQELFWQLDHASPGLIAYNVPRAFRVRGSLDADALQRALNEFLQRHEVLRSVYAIEGDQPVQVIVPDASVPLERVDLSHLPQAERDSALGRALAERAARPFNLSTDLLLRASLFRLGENDHALFLLTHHIVSDGWTKSVSFRDLSELYAAEVERRAPSLPAIPMQFGEFAKRERARLQGNALEASLAYWRAKLAGPLPTLAWVADQPRGGGAFAGDMREAILPAQLVESMRRLGQERGATLYMVLLAAYQTLLHRYSGQDDVIVGSPTAGRDDEQTHDLVGYLAGALVLRTSFAGDPSFAELVDRVSETCLDAYEHQDVPFEKLVLELQKGEQLTHAPLFQCVLTMEDTIPAELRLAGSSLETIDVSIPAMKFDLTLLFSEHERGLRLRLGFRTALFSAARAERALGHLRSLLQAAMANPDRRVSDLPLLTNEERATLAAANETTIDEGRAATLVDLFETQAARVPGRPAVVAPRASATAAGSVAGTVVLTYEELNTRANQLAHRLIHGGVSANTPVGLLLDRSADAIVGLVGILKAGGAYLPLATDAPASRIAQQLAESGANIVVTNAMHVDRVPAGITTIAFDRDASALGSAPNSNPAGAKSPEQLAYVLFTSGSTGVPKGVAVTHANAVHYARAVSRVLADIAPSASGDGFGALDALQFGLASTLAADLGNTSLLPSLLAGGTLHVLSKDVTTEPARFAEYVGVHRLDVLKITPNHLSALTAGRSGTALAEVLPQRWLVLGGEALRLDVARTLLAVGKCRVLNHYGPTETTVGVLTHEVTRSSIESAEAQGATTAPLGRPLANTCAFVVDVHGNELPIGVPGELWLGGTGVAQGYVKRDDLTAERFVAFRGSRVYRTGDRVRRLSDGTIEFLGRTDDQVKVRGFRVELGEIEQVLRTHPGVAQGGVVLREDTAGDPRLVAYVVAKQAGYAVSHSDRPTPEKVREWIAAHVPEYMVPSAVVMLDTLPLTPNGKLDRGKLPAPGVDPEAQDAFVAPRTTTEETVAKIWRDVLKKPRIGITESFLDLGGHSLLAIRVLGRINKELGVRLPLRSLFETPTVERIAATIDGELAQKAEADALRAALAAVESLSDDDVAKMLATDAPPEQR